MRTAKTTVALRQGPGSTSRDTPNNISELFIELNTPTNGRCQHSSFQRRPLKARLKVPEKLIKRLPETRLKQCRPCAHPEPYPWTITIKLLTKSSWVGTTIFQDRGLLCPLFPGKTIKLFFSTSPKTLRFDSAPVPRGQVFGIKRNSMGTSLVVQWLRHHASSVWGLGSIPGWWTSSHMPQLKILHAASKIWHSQMNK